MLIKSSGHLHRNEKHIHDEPRGAYGSEYEPAPVLRREPEYRTSNDETYLQQGCHGDLQTVA